MPGLAFVRRPRSPAGIGGDHHGAVVIVVVTVVATTIHVGQSKNSSSYWSWIAQSPGAATIVRSSSGCVVGIGGVEVAAADDAVAGVAEGDREGARARVADQRRVVSVPRVAAIGGGEDAGRGGTSGGDPRVALAFGGDAGAASRERGFTGRAGGMFALMLFQVCPLRMRRSGKTPLTESLCEMPRVGLQKAKQS